MNVESISFREAVERLTGEQWKPTQKAGTIPKRDNSHDDNLDLAAAIWKDALPLSAEAKAYLAQRGIDIGSVPEIGGLR